MYRPYCSSWKGGRAHLVDTGRRCLRGDCGQEVAGAIISFRFVITTQGAMDFPPRRALTAASRSPWDNCNRAGQCEVARFGHWCESRGPRGPRFVGRTPSGGVRYYDHLLGCR